MAELDAATKRLDQSEGGKNALVDQVNIVKLLGRVVQSWVKITQG